MKPQEAVSILMLSPCYWLLQLPQRKQLLQEFLANYDKIYLPKSFSTKQETVRQP